MSIQPPAQACGNCGFQNQPGDEFCGNCGRYLEFTSDDDAQPEAAPAAETAASADQSVVVEPKAEPPIERPLSAGATTVAPLTGPGGGQVAQAAPPWSTEPALQRCPRCGTANELTRAFCMNCGQALSRTGLTRGRVRGPGAGSTTGNDRDRTPWIIGAAAVLALLALGAAVVLGGGLFAPAAPGASPSPARSVLVAAGSASPGTVSPVVTDAPPTILETTDAPPTDALPTDAIVVTPGPPTPDVSADPVGPTASPATATAIPATSPPLPPDGFSCEPRVMSATAPGRWSVESARWARRDTYDYLALTLVPRAESAGTASVEAALVQRDEVTSIHGVAPPAQGDIALVLSFNGEVTSVGNFGSDPGLRAIREFRVERVTRQHVLVLIGIAGAGCFNLHADSWSGAAPIEIFVDIRR